MILAILQARMGSTRLPGKVLKPILGEPMLFRQIERLKRCHSFDQLVVATSTESTDDQLAQACHARGVDVTRGSIDDVLDRFIMAAKAYNPQTIVRLTGDCPLIDPGIIDDVVNFFISGDFDYASNVGPPTFPDGLDVEVMRASCLERAHHEAKLPSEREHVTPYLRNHPDLFRQGNFAGPRNLSHLRWTVDEPQDFNFVVQVFEQLYPSNPQFGISDVLRLIEQVPTLGTLNSDIKRNQGMEKSLASDAALEKQDAPKKDQHKGGTFS